MDCNTKINYQINDDNNVKGDKLKHFYPKLLNGTSPLHCSEHKQTSLNQHHIGKRCYEMDIPSILSLREMKSSRNLDIFTEMCNDQSKNNFIWFGRTSGCEKNWLETGTNAKNCCGNKNKTMDFERGNDDHKKIKKKKKKIGRTNRLNFERNYISDSTITSGCRNLKNRRDRCLKKVNLSDAYDSQDYLMGKSNRGKTFSDYNHFRDKAGKDSVARISEEFFTMENIGYKQKIKQKNDGNRKQSNISDSCSVNKKCIYPEKKEFFNSDVASHERSDCHDNSTNESESGNVENKNFRYMVEKSNSEAMNSHNYPFRNGVLINFDDKDKIPPRQLIFVKDENNIDCSDGTATDEKFELYQNSMNSYVLDYDENYEGSEDYDAENKIVSLVNIETFPAKRVETNHKLSLKKYKNVTSVPQKMRFGSDSKRNQNENLKEMHKEPLDARDKKGLKRCRVSDVESNQIDYGKNFIRDSQETIESLGVNSDKQKRTIFPRSYDRNLCNLDHYKNKDEFGEVNDSGSRIFDEINKNNINRKCSSNDAIVIDFSRKRHDNIHDVSKNKVMIRPISNYYQNYIIDDSLNGHYSNHYPNKIYNLKRNNLHGSRNSNANQNEDILAYRNLASSSVRSFLENVIVKPAKSYLSTNKDYNHRETLKKNHVEYYSNNYDKKKNYINKIVAGTYDEVGNDAPIAKDIVPLYPMHFDYNSQKLFDKKKIKYQKKGCLEPIMLTFKNLRFSLPNYRKNCDETVILDYVSGVFRPGEMIAIMGPSGCGKTTLLDMLADKKKAKYFGEVYVNGQLRDKFFRRIATYVSQDDFYDGSEKVREVLEFSSQLRMNYAWSKDGEKLRKKNIDETLEYLGLDHVQNSRVGNSVIRGLSGGQKRRLTLGRGTLSDAYIGFCDEPTSGLSPSDTELVLQAIKNMARLYRMIFVIVIHQPRWEAFQKFDKLILLSGGKCIYNGSAKKAKDYFAKIGFPCSPNINPADFFLDLVTPGYPGSSPEKLAAYYEKYIAPKVQRKVEKSLKEKHEPIGEIIKKGPKASYDHMYAVSRYKQFKLITKRFLQYWVRNTALIESLLTNAIVQALLIGFVFFSVRIERTIFQQLSSIFLMGIFVLLSTLSNVPLIVSQREKYIYEVGDAYYAPLPYLCSQQLVCYAVLVFCNTLMVSIAWALMGFEWRHFPFCLLIILLAYIAMDGFVSIFVLSSKNFAQANSAASFCLMFTAIFNGFNSNPNSMPLWFGWISYLSPFFYMYEGLSIQLFEEFDFDRYLTKFPNELVYTNIETLWETFGIAGRAYGYKIQVNTYKWFIDVGVLLIMAVIARVCMIYYQANCLCNKK